MYGEFLAAGDSQGFDEASEILEGIVIVDADFPNEDVQGMMSTASAAAQPRSIAALAGIVLGIAAVCVMYFPLPVLAVFLGLLALVLGLVAWGAEGVAFHMILSAMDIATPLLLGVGIYSISVLVGAISFVPGGLGTTEATMIAAASPAKTSCPGGGARIARTQECK